MSIVHRAPRTIALLLGLLPLLAVELLCRAAGWGDFRDRPDPFAGFSRLAPAFTRTIGTDGVAQFVATEGRPFATRSFLADKPDNGFRVFVFGGSTEAGTPYGYDFSFAEFLRRLLTEALPDRSIEVINCAAAGYASRRLLYLAEEVAAYQPDLFIVSTGHNELIEQRLYSHLFDYPIWVFELQQQLRQIRLYVLLADAIGAIQRADRAEVDGEKLYVPLVGPLASKYWRDQERDPVHQRRLALAMFETNLEKIVRVAQRSDASVLFLTQSKNYADWPVVGDPRDPIAARAIEHHRRAEAFRAEGKLDRAREQYRLAQNTINANFGTTPGRNAMVMELAKQNDELVLDIESIFEANSPHGLVGFNLFVDFLHPNLAGHQLLARSVFEFLRDRALPARTWQEPGALASPDEILAEHPTLGAQELRIRIVAEVMNERTEVAAELIAELRMRFPEDPDLERLEAWLAGDLPFDFDLVY
jgi:lysophospholipase L1-like esterase